MIVRVSDLEVTYLGPPPVSAIRGVSFNVAAGETVSVVGASGSGKTSLLHVLGALLPPTKGTCEVLGVDLFRASEKERNALRAGGIGFVFQEFHLLSYRSPLDNAAIGGLYQGRSNAERRVAAAAAIESLRIGHRSLASVRELSGGERQRLAIARALVGRPKLLLCDEPTGNLDSDNARSIVSLLKQLAADMGLTVIVATHDPAVQAGTDRSLTLRDGRLTR